MGKGKVVNLVLDTYGSFLGMEKGCIVLRDKKGNTERYPLFETKIGEINLKSGNSVSTGVLTALGFWGINVVLTSRRGIPIATLKNLEDDSHVKTRICQYEALKNGKGIHIAKQLVLRKIEGQNMLLNKHGLRCNDFLGLTVNSLTETDPKRLRQKLLSLEGKNGEIYFGQIFQLFSVNLKPKKRIGFKAYDGINNTFNLAYMLLFWRCYKALIKAHLEPYLGFLHSVQYGRPSLVCDFQELYRHLVDDFLIQYCQQLKPRDFITVSDTLNDKKSKRIYLKNSLADDLTNKLQRYFTQKVKIPNMKRGAQQELDTLINEEALLLAKYLRGERESWSPRLAIPISK
jgi:CRISPR-associated protein Cas1